MDAMFSQFLLWLMRLHYRTELQSHGVPINPANRTAAQQQTAGLVFWAVTSEVKMLADGLAQSALEVTNG